MREAWLGALYSAGAVPAFVASWLVILGSLSYGIAVRGSSIMGVEFAGGDSLHAGAGGILRGQEAVRQGF